MSSNKKEIERLAQTWRNSGIDEGDNFNSQQYKKNYAGYNK